MPYDILLLYEEDGLSLQHITAVPHIVSERVSLFGDPSLRIIQSSYFLLYQDNYPLPSVNRLTDLV